MKTKRFLSALLVLILLFALAPGAPVQAADSSWSAVYKRFVMEREYLSTDIKLNYYTDAYSEPSFSLYDVGGDGTPELLIRNGGPSASLAQIYLFSVYNGHASWRGKMGYNPYYYAGAAYRGLFCNVGEGTSFTTVYYDLPEGVLLDNAVRTAAMQADGGQLSTQMTYDRELYAWATKGVPNYLHFYTYDQIAAMGWDGFVCAALWDSAGQELGNAVEMSESQQYEANVFLSNFSEQRTFEGNPEFDVSDARYTIVNKLVEFAYLYCTINDYSSLGTARDDEDYYITLSLDRVSKVCSRFFGFTINDADAALYEPYEAAHYRAFYDGGTFYHTASYGEAYNRFSVVRRMEDLGDGTYRMLFDIYRLDIAEYRKTDGVGASFYAMTAAAARADTARLTWEASGAAVVKPYSYNGRSTYQLVRYTVFRDEPLPAPIKDSGERTVEYKVYSTQFGPEELSLNALAGLDNHNLALLCAMLSEASYDTTGGELLDLYSQMFPEESWDKEFDYKGEDFCYGAALGRMRIGGEDVNVLFVTIKGSKLPAIWEYAADLVDFTGDYRDYKVFATISSFGNSVRTGVNKLLARHSDVETMPLKVVFTGHSLGGAAANLLAAQVTMQSREDEQWKTMTSKENVYCYTFGALDCIDVFAGASGGRVVKFPIGDGFENIHNIYNIYDDFGPYRFALLQSRKFSVCGKFGHIDLFRMKYKKDGNHAMTNYLHSVNAEIVGEKTLTCTRLSIRCPVDVEVFENNALVGSVHGGEVTLLSDEIDITLTEDEKVVICPADKVFSLRLTATDDGTMDYTVETLSADAAGVKLFENVALVKGKTMISEIGANAAAAEVRLFVTDERGKRVAEVKEDGSETETRRSDAIAAPAASKAKSPVLPIAAGAALLCVAAALAVRFKKRQRRKRKHRTKK